MELKVLVTGGAGYIGSVLTRQLLSKGYRVRVLDILNFGGESLLGILNDPNFEFQKGDVRIRKDIDKAIKDVDAVVHLAAIVGDPACAKEPDIANETNLEASINLFNTCEKSKNIKKFIFASTCSNYGKMKLNEFVTEESPLKPVSHYAKLKVSFEKYLLESKTRSDFVPTSLRFATVYGISPRMRFDLTVNEFTRDAALERELIIFGEQFWRPYCHVGDLASSCILVLETSSEKIDHRVFGVGDTNENYQKKMLADEILRVLPETRIKYVHKAEDPRDYKVDFSCIKNELGFKITRTVPVGINEIAYIIQNGILADPDNKIYRNS
jgi:nucleoside-diphosphate-sugar epimerase